MLCYKLHNINKNPKLLKIGLEIDRLPRESGPLISSKICIKLDSKTTLQISLFPKIYHYVMWYSKWVYE